MTRVISVYRRVLMLLIVITGTVSGTLASIYGKKYFKTVALSFFHQCCPIVMLPDSRCLFVPPVACSGKVHCPLMAVNIFPPKTRRDGYPIYKRIANP